MSDRQLVPYESQKPYQRPYDDGFEVEDITGQDTGPTEEGYHTGRRDTPAQSNFGGRSRTSYVETDAGHQEAWEEVNDGVPYVHPSVDFGGASNDRSYAKFEVPLRRRSPSPSPPLRPARNSRTSRRLHRERGYEEDTSLPPLSRSPPRSVRANFHNARRGSSENTHRQNPPQPRRRLSISPPRPVRRQNTAPLYTTHQTASGSSAPYVTGSGRLPRFDGPQRTRRIVYERIGPQETRRIVYERIGPQETRRIVYETPSEDSRFFRHERALDQAANDMYALDPRRVELAREVTANMANSAPRSDPTAAVIWAYHNGSQKPYQALHRERE